MARRKAAGGCRRVPFLACQCVAMRVHPVIEDAATVVSVVAESMGQPLSLHSELDVDVYRLRPSGTGPDGPDLVARVFGPGVERAMVDTAAHVLQRLAGTRFPAERCTGGDPVLALGGDRHVLDHRVRRAVTSSQSRLRAGLVRGAARPPRRPSRHRLARRRWLAPARPHAVERDRRGACPRWPRRTFGRRARRHPGRRRRRRRAARGADPRRPHAAERRPTRRATPGDHRLDRGGARSEDLAAGLPAVRGRPRWRSASIGPLCTAQSPCRRRNVPGCQRS